MTKSEFDVQAAAEEIIAARAAGERLQPFSERFPDFDLAAAYRVAGVVACRRAATSPVVGRKIGFTNRAIWESAGLTEPAWGSMFESTVIRNPAGEELPEIAMAGTVEPKIECEVVVVLETAPEPGERGAAIARRIRACGLGFEVVDSPYPGWRMKPADAVAAGGIHHALAVGPMMAPGDYEAFSNMLARLRVSMRKSDADGGDDPVHGSGAMVMGNPLDAVGVLAEIAAGQGNPLQPGEIITTGTLTPPLPCRAGETWRAEGEGVALPRVGVRLT